jgi:hypothetical protein
VSGRMDWRRARLAGKPSLDYRREGETPDWAQRWIEAVERRQRERRTTTVTSSSASLVRKSTR